MGSEQRPDVTVAASLLNVDLEVFSDRPLDALVTALEPYVVVLYLGKARERHLVTLELASCVRAKSPDPIIKEFIRLINDLPPAAQTLWTEAAARHFDIGVQMGSSAFQLVLEPSTVAAVAAVNGTFAFTMYPK